MTQLMFKDHSLEDLIKIARRQNIISVYVSKHILPYYTKEWQKKLLWVAIEDKNKIDRLKSYKIHGNKEQKIDYGRPKKDIDLQSSMNQFVPFYVKSFGQKWSRLNVIINKYNERFIRINSLDHNGVVPTMLWIPYGQSVSYIIDPWWLQCILLDKFGKYDPDKRTNNE